MSNVTRFFKLKNHKEYNHSFFNLEIADLVKKMTHVKFEKNWNWTIFLKYQFKNK